MPRYTDIRLPISKGRRGQGLLRGKKSKVLLVRKNKSVKDKLTVLL